MNAKPQADPFFIYQVELSSHCNMKCSYCPHPTMQREQGYMSEEVLGACIQRFKSQGGSVLVLHHFGEPLLHPRLANRLRQVADAGLAMQLSSNTLLLDRSFDTLVSIPAPITVMVSVHRWVNKDEQEYFAAVDAWKQRAEGTNLTIVHAYNLRAGKYTLHRWTNGASSRWDPRLCPFVKENLAVVLWNGDIANCCCDHEGFTVKQNILDADCDSHLSTVWRSCRTCDVGRLMVGETWRPANHK
ncbi:MAG TPA: radical SAM protein [Pyrinomonadaceae bacterium]|nr:radical SAM protein [Pyrinomonadaceae bacterium]